MHDGGRGAGSEHDSNLTPITVQAHHEVQKRQVGMTYTGIPIEQVSLSREVGYVDLDLSTACISGAVDGAMNQEKTIVASLASR